MPDVIANNPALVVGVIRALLNIAILLGVKLTLEQEAAIIVVANLLLSFVTAHYTVPKTPTATAPTQAIQTPPPDPKVP